MLLIEIKPSPIKLRPIIASIVPIAKLIRVMPSIAAIPANSKTTPDMIAKVLVMIIISHAPLCVRCM